MAKKKNNRVVDTKDVLILLVTLALIITNIAWFVAVMAQQNDIRSLTRRDNELQSKIIRLESCINNQVDMCDTGEPIQGSKR